MRQRKFLVCLRHATESAYHFAYMERCNCNMGAAAKERYLSFPRNTRHNPWLDMMRTVAVVLVLMRHGERSYTATLAENHTNTDILSLIFLNGWVGVDIFLVLSGYLIGCGLFSRFRRNSFELWSYFRDRALRILPAYYAVLLATAWGMFPGHHVESDNLGFRIFYHIIFLQDYLASDINVVFWSLGVEEKFYILAPAVTLIILRISNIKNILLLFCALWVISPLYKLIYFGTFGNEIEYVTFFRVFRSPFHSTLEALITGLAVSYITIVLKVRLSAYVAGIILGICGIVLLFSLGSHEWLLSINWVDVSAQPILISVVVGLSLIAATNLNKVRLVGEPIWRTVSRLSYALYLVHLPLIPLAIGFGSILGDRGIGFWLSYFFLSFSAALLLHFFIEKPFLQYKAFLNSNSIPSSQPGR